MKKQLIRLYFFIFLITLIDGCAIKKPSLEGTGGMTVDWKSDLDRPMPTISKEVFRGKYGPHRLDELSVVDKYSVDKPIKISAFIFSPGGYRSLALIPLLKKVNYFENGVNKPSIVMGHGLSSVVAAYYGFGYKSDYIEWKFFKFIRRVKNVEMFSMSWMEVFREELIDDFKGKNIEDSKLTLIIPSYSEKERSVKFLRRGPLTKVLLENISMYSRNKVPPFSKKMFDENLFDKLGATHIYTFDLISRGISWKSGRGEINGFYERAASQIKNITNKEKVIVVDFNFDKIELDNIEKISDLMFEAKKRSDSIVNKSMTVKF